MRHGIHPGAAQSAGGPEEGEERSALLPGRGPGLRVTFVPVDGAGLGHGWERIPIANRARADDFGMEAASCFPGSTSSEAERSHDLHQEVSKNMSTVPSLDRGVLSEKNAEKRDELIGMLKKAYWMEIETVMSYITNSVNPDGLRAQEVIEALEADIQEELAHAQLFAERIKQLWGVVPGSMDFQAEQSYLQPPETQVDIVHVIQGVIQAERGAIDHYNKMIKFCEDFDPVTADMVTGILRDEEGHLRLFEGFLREFEHEGLA
jgi:bacterioferritin